MKIDQINPIARKTTPAPRYIICNLDSSLDHILDKDFILFSIRSWVALSGCAAWGGEYYISENFL
jgi:hypothetical protein